MAARATRAWSSRRQRSIGSGAIIDADGYIVTNAHVIAGAQRVQVVLPADPATDGRAGWDR